MGFVKDVWDGITGKTAAKASQKAGEMQADASKYAADLSQKQFEQTRQDQMPWLNAGKQALGGLQNYINQNKQYNDKYGDQLNQAMPNLTTKSDLTRFGDKMGRIIHQNYDAGDYTDGLDPDNLQLDPSYQFRKKEGMDGIQSSAAAGGGLLSGAALKALNEYNSNLASQEYSSAWNRNIAENQNQFAVDSGLRSQDYGIFAGEQDRINNTQRADQQHIFNLLSNMRGQDYNLFSGEDARQYNQLANLAGVGQQTATNLGTFGAQNAQTVGNAYTDAARANAAGLVGGANARQQSMGRLLGLGAKAFGLI